MNKIGDKVFEGIQPSGVANVSGWNSDQPLFRELIEKTQPTVIIEVGTWLGASAIHMAKICRELGLQTTIYCVDTWLGAEEFWTSKADTEERNLRQKNGYPQVYFDFLANVVQHDCQDLIVPIPNTSTIGSIILQDRRVLADLIYIDGSHEYQDVKTDVLAYKKLLSPKGLMFGDDTGWGSVKMAISEVCPNHREIGNFWLVDQF
jgi:hypothetical protein